MIEMMNHPKMDRILDLACGSRGFLVMVLDHVRQKIAAELCPDLDCPLLVEEFNSIEVNERVK